MMAVWTWTQVVVLAQVGGRIVVVVPVVVSRRVALADSELGEVQCGWYQNARLVAAPGVENVCVSDESPLGAHQAPPTVTERVPPCAGVVRKSLPRVVQPVRSPVSKPPFTIVVVVAVATVSCTVVVWVLDEPVPVTVRV